MKTCRIVALLQVLWSLPLAAHDMHGHRGLTYEIADPIRTETGLNWLKLSVLGRETNQPTAARFSLIVDGQEYIPDALGENGLHFISIHAGKRQRFTALYARGRGAIDVPLPVGARSGAVHVAKGLEYLPAKAPFTVTGDTTSVTVSLSRWSDVRSRGWLPVEEHLHYDRTHPAHDRDWLTILAGDDLAYGHFLVLKGGNLPGIWASQYAYGEQGQASDGERLICPGQEYRDSMQGHINLLGVKETIPPVLAGTSEHPYHFPTLYDVLQQARKLGALVGPAHGTALGRSPSGIADTVLGAVDFFEIANTHLYKTDVWYRLMNCGYVVAPAAGTDLPNYPFRDAWQPLLGEVRMYAHTAGGVDFASFKQAVRAGKVFVSGGPMIQVMVDRVGPGGTVRLPAGGGEVLVTAELSGPRPLKSFDVLCNGKALISKILKKKEGRVYHWQISQRMRITQSSWVAARGEGVAKRALAQHTGIRQNTIAHTGVVRVLVAEEPITSAGDASFLIEHLTRQIEVYRSKAKYKQPEEQVRALGIFQSAIKELERQTK